MGVDSFVFRILENVMRNEFRILRSNPVKWSITREKVHSWKKRHENRIKGCRTRLKGKKFEEKVENFT